MVVKDSQLNLVDVVRWNHQDKWSVISGGLEVVFFTWIVSCTPAIKEKYHIFQRKQANKVTFSMQIWNTINHLLNEILAKLDEWL